MYLASSSASTWIVYQFRVLLFALMDSSLATQTLLANAAFLLFFQAIASHRGSSS